jgi:hypothetical protein
MHGRTGCLRLLLTLHSPDFLHQADNWKEPFCNLETFVNTELV